MVIDAADRVFQSSWTSSRICIVDPDTCSVVECVEFGGNGDCAVAFGPGGEVWGTDLYAACSGNLYRIDPQSCQETLMGEGFGVVPDLAFGPDGALYASTHLEERVLRIAPAACGDNVVNDPSEECDGTDDDACPGECYPPGHPHECRCPFCGDAVVGPGEECDDGNNVSGDGCDENCMLDVLQPIPTVSEWGLVVLGLVLVASAKIYFGRRRPSMG